MPKRLTRADYLSGVELERYLGREVGVRRSAADIAAQLPTLDQRTPQTQTLVRKMATRWIASGLAIEAPGPRGGAGWALSPAGAALIAQALVWKSPATVKAEARAAAVAARREAAEVDYHAILRRLDGTERITIRALTIQEAATIARQRLRFTSERVVAVWEAAAGDFAPALDPEG
ncbi:hypothetical protein ABMY26_07280 (plasmid) [Azospirillum sp. HJ39]|uniref:hypothetical protein n=1 Tax=Azospirillum sp. HJ39 TaxID=3159496 RepID=UPI003557A789